MNAEPFDEAMIIGWTNHKIWKVYCRVIYSDSLYGNAMFLG